VGSNDTLECNFLSENAHRALPSSVQTTEKSEPAAILMTFDPKSNGTSFGLVKFSTFLSPIPV
jgi:hypothetical protein